ncbi:MAG: cell division protein FtsQ/DivIB [Candidatus Merdivicinus sp.]|jgi:cell division protein FtsQ
MPQKRKSNTKRAVPRNHPTSQSNAASTRKSSGKQKQSPAKKAAPKQAHSAKKQSVRQYPPGYRPTGKKNITRPVDRNKRSQSSLDPNRAAAIGEVHRKRRHRHKRNYILYYIILFFFLSVTGIVLSLTVFFKIETITVQGSEVYSEADVVPLLDAKVGDNLLRIRTGKMEETLLENLPQADQVEIRRDFPSGLKVTLTDGVPSAQLYAEGEYYIISQSGRILQQSEEALPDCGVVVVGVSLENASVGEYVEDVQKRSWEEASALAQEQKQDEPEKPDDLENLRALFSALNTAQFSDINAVDITDEVALTIYWQNRIQIQLGSFSELDYKLRFVKEILTDEKYASIITPESIGILDAQSASSVLPFQPLTEITVPGGGVGSWNWDDDEPAEEEFESSVPDEVSSESSQEESEAVVVSSDPESSDMSVDLSEPSADSTQ